MMKLSAPDLWPYNLSHAIKQEAAVTLNIANGTYKKKKHKKTWRASLNSLDSFQNAEWLIREGEGGMDGEQGSRTIRGEMEDLV